MGRPRPARRACLVAVGLAAALGGRAAPVAAAAGGAGEGEGGIRGMFVGAAQQGPITIDARRFEADNRRHTATYLDQVVAKQNDTTLTADRLTVAYGDGRRISLVTAEGSVRIVQKVGAPAAGPGGGPTQAGDREALCGRIVFHAAEDRVVCTGTPATLKQGDDVIRGPKITVELAEERIVVEGDASVPRVTSRISPRAEAAPPQTGAQPSGQQAGGTRP